MQQREKRVFALKVSVVIPLYNKARHIARAVASVRGQTWRDFEIIVVDDGSTDGSGDVIRRMADSRLRLITQPNGGECAARNRGIDEAASDWVAFLDADDEWLPSFLETVVGLRQMFPDCGIYAAAYSLCQNGAVLRPEFHGCPASPAGGVLDDYFASAVRTPPVTSSSVMIPKHILRAMGGFPVGVKRGGDLATWARIALRYRIAWSPVPGAIYHLSADNRACDLHPAHCDVPGAAEIERFLDAGNPTLSSPSGIKEYLACMRLTLAKHFCLAGQKGLALDLLAKTASTVSHARRRRMLALMLWLPPAFLKAAVNSKASVRTALKSFSGRRRQRPTVA
jgi:hypothetical protein